MNRKKKKTFQSVDTLSRELDAVDNFVLRHWKKYLLAAIVVIIGIAAFLIFSYRSETGNIEKSQAILTAATPKELQEVIKKYPNYPLTEFAKLKLFSTLVTSKKYPEAITLYNSLIGEVSNPYIMSQANLNYAYLIEKQGKKEEAATLFSTLSNDGGVPITIRCEAAYSAGRIYSELGNKNLATEYLSRCAAVNNMNCYGWPEMAQALLNRVK